MALWLDRRFSSGRARAFRGTAVADNFAVSEQSVNHQHCRWFRWFWVFRSSLTLFLGLQKGTKINGRRLLLASPHSVVRKGPPTASSPSDSARGGTRRGNQGLLASPVYNSLSFILWMLLCVPVGVCVFLYFSFSLHVFLSKTEIRRRGLVSLSSGLPCSACDTRLQHANHDILE